MNIAPIKIKLQIGGSYYDLSGISPEDMTAVVGHVASVKAIVEKYNTKKQPLTQEEDENA